MSVPSCRAEKGRDQQTSRDLGRQSDRPETLGSRKTQCVRAKRSSGLVGSKLPGLALADHPTSLPPFLTAGSRELCRQLEARGIPFLFYTVRDRINDKFATAPTNRKTAPPSDVVE